MRSVRIALLIGPSLALAGCGAGESKGPVEPIKVGIYSSAKECSAVGKLRMEGCVKAIELAGNEHDTRTILYKKLKQCEADAGPDNCETAGGNFWRPRLEAYVVTSQGATVVARPLYAAKGDNPFKDLDGRTYSVADETITVSQSAHVRAAVINPKIADGAGEIADAANNIH